MFPNCDVIVIFLMCGQFVEIWKPDSGRIISKTLVTFYLAKTKNRTKVLPTQISHYCFEKRYYFYQFTKKC